MIKKLTKTYQPTAFAQASILRKFTILFLIMSFIPTCILYYFYSEIKSRGNLQLTATDLNLTLTFVVLGVILGYFSMRAVLTQLIDLSNANKKALEEVLSPEKIAALKSEDNEITVLSESFNAIADKLEESVTNLKLAKKTLYSIMKKVSDGIANMENIDTFLELILETITEAMSGQVGAILLKDRSKKDLWVKTIHGRVYDETQLLRLPVGSDSALAVSLENKKPFLITPLSAEYVEFKKYQNLFSAPMLCSPLVNKNRVIGAITVSGRRSKEFDEDEQNLLFNLASQTAVAIENSRLNKDVERTYFETISALALAVDAKDKYSRGHLDRVADYCVRIAQKMGLDDAEIQALRDAARLHDLGKIGIPDEVLGKQGTLNDREMELMKRHPEIGESIIKPISSLNHLCDIIRHHHEWLDGSGYPDGLKGDEISPLVRILTVANIYDALTTDYPNRKRLPREQAYEIMRGMKDKIDMDVVDVLIETLNDQ